MLRGSVEALDLVQVLQLLHDCGGTGELRIWAGDREKRVYFKDGNIVLHSRNNKPIDPKTFEDALYDLLFIERGAYAFRPLRELKIQHQGVLDTPTILVEASRRQDEWERINQTLPSRKAILLPAKRDAEVKIKEKLNEIGVKAKLRFGKLSVEEMVERAGKQFDMLRQLVALCEEQVLRPVPEAEIENQIATRLNGKPRRSAFRLYEWLHEIDELANTAEAFDHVLLRKNWLSVGGFSCRTPGPRALHMLSRLLRYKEDFEFVAQGNDAALCVTVEDRLLTVSYRGEIDCPAIMDRVEANGVMTAEQIAEARRIAADFGCDPEDLLVDRRFMTPRTWINLRLEQFLDICFSLFTWSRPLLQVRTEPVDRQDFAADPEASSVVIPLDSSLRQQLRLGLMKWKLFRQVVPSMDAIFKCARPTPKGQPRRAHDHLDGRRRVSDLSAMSRATGQELLQFIYRAVKDGRLRALSSEEHMKLVRRARDQDRPADVLAAYQSGLAFGYDDFKTQEEVKKAVEWARRQKGKRGGAVSVLEGSLKYLNLAAIIQLLCRCDVEGTLRVTQREQGERILHFVDGGLFVLLTPEQHGETLAPNEFLTESTEDLLDSLRRAFDNNTPERIEEFKAQMQEEILESLFWERASFEFARNFIPSEFYAKSNTVTKIKLPEERLLFQAMQRMAEWDQLREVLQSIRAVFEFVTAEAKMDAYREFGEFVYFLDGQRSLGELVVLSGVPRLQLYRNLCRMIEQDMIVLKTMKSPRETQASDTERIRWDLSVQ